MCQKFDIPSRKIFLSPEFQSYFTNEKYLESVNGIVGELLKKEEISDEIKNAAFLIYKITNPYLVQEERVFKYKPFYVFADGGRSCIPEDLSIAELGFLDSVADGVENLILKARIADIIWYRNYGNSNLQKAIMFIETILSLPFDEDSFFRYEIYFRRAISIARSIKYDFNKISSFKEKLIEFVGICQYVHPGIPKRIFDAIKIAPVEDDIKAFLNLLEIKIQDAKPEEKYWSTDISYLKLKLECLKFLNLSEIECRLDIARRFEIEAIDCERKKDFLCAHHHYAMAIQYYETIPRLNRDDYKIDEKLAILKSKKQEVGIATRENMKVYSQEIKIPRGQLQAVIKLVSDKSYPGVLFDFASITNGFPNLIKLREQAEDSIKRGDLSDLLPKTIMTSGGRVAGIVDAIDLTSEESKELAISRKMVELYFLNFNFYIPILLEALNILNNQHHIEINKIADVCVYSSIIPKDRIGLWVKGIYYGFNEDFETSMQILTAQIEHLVRVKMLESGLNTAVKDQDGSENEKALCALLDNIENNPQSNIFTQEELFELKAIFGNIPNANMRNIIAHGLFNDGEYFAIAVYIWYFALKWVLKTIPVQYNSKIKDY